MDKLAIAVKAPTTSLDDPGVTTIELPELPTIELPDAPSTDDDLSFSHASRWDNKADSGLCLNTSQ